MHHDVAQSDPFKIIDYCRTLFLRALRSYVHYFDENVDGHMQNFSHPPCLSQPGNTLETLVNDVI